ncbi:SDR family oxidoreductase [Massilia sp. Dwa41.01b]|uniref:SDR family NAD(P)-dependent oxidoreductase n=1 Tax=unclassified Massilia TaxID=2609279 RepID=UPI001600A9D3|nr:MULTISPECIES: SDR family oxidoreductase [unclassified Massilia]QNA89999.1 SDR family oxidoreductase [Massilia sp. Dwa41.01b]QNB00884.1 SDR family oxidoreductase [Massilia sp. Se16.2.3]
MSKVLIVTGASRGIGAAIALRAAREGYAVAVNYRHDERAAASVVDRIRAGGGRALAVAADVGAAGEVDAMFRRVHEEMGPVSALVNNAGVTGRIGSFMNTDPASIEEVFRINVHGTMHCSRAAVGAFRRSAQGGVIVNLSSAATLSGSPGEYVHYAASKAAVEAFTLGLARELATEGIRVCGVSPGSTLTDIHAAAGEPERPARVAPRIPMGRLATPEEIAEPVVWLLSGAASYVTGSILRVSGGL